MPRISQVTAHEILDSRGRPTLQVECCLKDGTSGVVSVPSGASTGRSEAHELRDGDPKRYRGLGCLKAVDHVNTIINASVSGSEFDTQAELDQLLIEEDESENKSNLGANAILGTSLAFARAVSLSNQVPLYDYFAQQLGEPVSRLPRPTINLFSGGKHAGAQVPIQDVLVVSNAPTVNECLSMTWEVYQCAAELCAETYQTRALSADEGGLAPPFESVERMIEDAVRSMERAGLKPGKDMCVAIDVASSHFYQDGTYHIGNQQLDSSAMIALMKTWIDTYPIVSLEDALAEDDWEAWPRLHETIGDLCLVLGDDFLCTNPARIRKAQDANAANALLLKVNQIGTLTEALEACRLARSSNWHVTISARSGETEDNWLADLAAGWRGDQIKVGSITQSERLAKYNRLLLIEQETRLPMTDWPRP